jgi:hypothetical protein
MEHNLEAILKDIVSSAHFVSEKIQTIIPVSREIAAETAKEDGSKERVDRLINTLANALGSLKVYIEGLQSKTEELTWNLNSKIAPFNERIAKKAEAEKEKGANESTPKEEAKPEAEAVTEAPAEEEKQENDNETQTETARA